MFYEIQRGKRVAVRKVSLSREESRRDGGRSLLAALPRVGATDNENAGDRVMPATRKRNVIRCEIED